MMKFQFDTFMDFFLMDGHGAFVWASYLITASVILLMVAIPKLQKRELLAQLKRQQRIEESQA